MNPASCLLDSTIETHTQEYKTGMVAKIPIVTHNAVIDDACLGVYFVRDFVLETAA